jgi:hypothetical protein
MIYGYAHTDGRALRLRWRSSNLSHETPEPAVKSVRLLKNSDNWPGRVIVPFAALDHAGPAVC